ncbi:MAG: SDR family NAD(P)-dependent oxidoreductase [Rhizobiales bacterium]|nr:SDR family NAD(P)-dependent oxidoreductase [Hyphomicrobiales bacterium]
MTKTPRRWLITGVSSGFGRAIAEAALAEGDMVFGTVRKSEDKVAFEELAPDRAIGCMMDVRDVVGVSNAVKMAQGDDEGIDVLVNNAGYGLMGAIEEVSMDEVRQQMGVNLMGPINMIQAVLPDMRKRKSGHIINITSISGLATWHGMGIYSASKFALEAIGETLAEEVNPLGIKVTNVEPGAFKTDFSGRSISLAKEQIEDYDATAHVAVKMMSAEDHEEAGDPRKAAQAILAIVAAEEPPLHLMLGKDALYYFNRKNEALIAEIEKWKPLTLSTDFS